MENPMEVKNEDAKKQEEEKENEKTEELTTPKEQDVEKQEQTEEMSEETDQQKKGCTNSYEQSSPRGVLEIPISGSDSDHSSSISSERSNSFGSSLDEKSLVQKGCSKDGNVLQWKNLFDNFRKRSVRRFSIVPLLVGQDFARKSTRRKLGRNRSSEENLDCGDIVAPKPSWRNFSYEELAEATDHFSPV